MKTKLFGPVFVLFVVYLFLFSSSKMFFVYAIAVLIHEIAHYYTAKRLGYKLSNFYIMPYGVCLNYNECLFNPKDEFLIAFSGPIINLVMCVCCLALWWVFPSTYYFLDYFCFCNLILGAFNLFPCFPLDGGRMFALMLSKKMDNEKAYKITVFLNYIFSLVLIILFVSSFFFGINFSYIFTAIFLFAGSISPNKYSKYVFVNYKTKVQVMAKNGADIKTFAASDKTPLYKIISKFSKKKFNIVYVLFSNGSVKVLTEMNITSLSEKYSAAFSLSEIMALKN